MNTFSLNRINSGSSLPGKSPKGLARVIIQGICAIFRTFMVQQQKIAELRELLSADDAVLRDIGVDRLDVRIMLRDLGADTSADPVPRHDQLGQRS